MQTGHGCLGRSAMEQFFSLPSTTSAILMDNSPKAKVEERLDSSMTFFKRPNICSACKAMSLFLPYRNSNSVSGTYRLKKSSQFMAWQHAWHLKTACTRRGTAKSVVRGTAVRLQIHRPDTFLPDGIFRFRNASVSCINDKDKPPPYFRMNCI